MSERDESALQQVRRLRAAFRTLETWLDQLERTILGIEAEHFREDDSPKGETVPGVRH